MVNENILGKRLKKLREDRELLQKDVAKVLGTSDRAVGNYENGIRNPDPETLNKLAKFFNCSTDYLLGLTDHPFSYDTDTNKKGYLNESDVDLSIPDDVKIMMRDASSLSEEQRKIIANIIKEFKESKNKK